MENQTGSSFGDISPKLSLPRRAFLKMAGLAVPVATILAKIPQALAGHAERGHENYWRQGIFIQDNVNMSKIDRGIIGARINDCWGEYRMVELDEAFMKWNLETRLEQLKQIAEGNRPGLAGPHSAAVATHGGGRRDSWFTLNNAIKGMGLAPKKERGRELVKKLRSTMKADMAEKLEILRDNYRHPALWDRTKQISLELYTQPDFETHTFLNIMANPLATITFLDMPSYELRTIARIVHPDDANMVPEERDLLEYANLAHDYFHGQSDSLRSLLAFHIIEQFDNSPRSGKGVRVRPPLPEE